MTKQTNVATQPRPQPRSQPRPHYGIQDPPQLPKDQHPAPARRVIPRDVIKQMMIKETRATPLSPRNKCIRCSTMLIHKFLIMIEQPWPNEPDYVCRLCYNKKNDRKVTNDQYRRRR